MTLNLPNNLAGGHLSGCLRHPINYGISNTRFSSSTTELNVAIGGASLVNLHNQILTLKETIMSLESMIKNDDNSAEGSVTETFDSQNKMEALKASENMGFEADDFIKIQEEYNKLMFKKHQV
jgi:hypothetical protein